MPDPSPFHVAEIVHFVVIFWLALQLLLYLDDFPTCFVGACDFEHGLCTWTNAHTGDDFDWNQKSGSTASQRTGPSQDHTLQNAQGKVLHSC